MYEWLVKSDYFIQRWMPILYLVIALPMVVALIFLTPPLAVPDEGAHFLRAVQVSQGQLLPEYNPPQLPGGWFADKVVQFATSDLFQRNFDVTYMHGVDQHFLTEPESERSKIRSLGWDGPRVFISYPATVRYPATSYAVPGISLFICRTCGASLLKSFYWGRLANGFCSLVIGMIALKYCSQMRLFLLCILTLPMTLSLQGSYSQDATIINVSTLIVTLLFSKNQIHPLLKWGCIAFLMSCIVGAKAFYAPLYIILFSCLSRPIYRNLSVLMALSFAIVIFDNLEGLKVPMTRGIVADPNLQLLHLENHPSLFVKALINTLETGEMPEETIGILGYFELKLSPGVYVCYGLALFAAFLRDLIDIKFKKTLFPIMLFLLGIAMIMVCSLWAFLLQYIDWSPLDGNKIVGVQGRYFVPLLIFFVMCMSVIKESSRDGNTLLKGSLSLVCYTSLVVPVPFIWITLVTGFLYS